MAFMVHHLRIDDFDDWKSLFDADPVGRKQVTLFNLATTATVVLGVLALYAALLLLALVTAPVLVPSRLLDEGIGHAVRVGDYMKLVWLTSSLATLGGALGAGLESDEVVRAAAYTHRQDRSRGVAKS